MTFLEAIRFMSHLLGLRLGSYSSELHSFDISKHLLFARINVVLIPNNHLSFLHSIQLLIRTKIKVFFILSWHWNVIVSSTAPNKEIRKYQCSALGKSPCSCAAVHVMVWLKQNVWLARWCYHARALSCSNRMGLKKRQISTYSVLNIVEPLLCLFYITWYTQKK